jgi:hypothetical protein
MRHKRVQRTISQMPSEQGLNITFSHNAHAACSHACSEMPVVPCTISACFYQAAPITKPTCRCRYTTYWYIRQGALSCC